MEQTPMRLYYFYINHSVHVAKACLIFITFTFREQTTSNINVICQENWNLLNSSILKIVHCFAIHLPEKPSASHDLNIITSYDSHASDLISSGFTKCVNIIVHVTVLLPNCIEVKFY